MLPMSLHTYLYHCLSLSSMYRPHGSLMSHDFFCWQAVTETHPHPSASPAVGRLSAFQPSSIFRHASLPGMCPRSAMMVEAARGHTSPLRSLSTQSWSQRGRLQEITGGLVLIVHHTGKDASKGLRGHSSLFAALDGAIEVERSSNSRCWSAAKVKDGEDGKQVPFKLNVIELGKDSDGDPVTSCAGSDDIGAIFQAKPPSGKHQISALSAIRRALGASSSTGQGGAPSGSACIRFEEAVTQSAPELAGVEKKRRAARAREAVQGLVSSGHLHRGLDDNEEEWVWL